MGRVDLSLLPITEKLKGVTRWWAYPHHHMVSEQVTGSSYPSSKTKLLLIEECCMPRNFPYYRLLCIIEEEPQRVGTRIQGIFYGHSNNFRGEFQR